MPLPRYTTKTYLTISVAPGPRAEPTVGTEEFLASYLEHTCWLRVITSREHYLTLSDPKGTKLQRLAALAAFYQTAGLVAEDALSMYVAWSLWALDKARPLVDILERVTLRLSEPKSKLADTYARDTQRKYLGTDKRLDVYARDYLNQLMLVHDNALPAQFGMNWKRNPSVKLVPKKYMPAWERLPHNLRGSLEPLVARKGARLAACYNKIKHGPQLIVMSPATAARRRGIEEVEPVLEEPMLRLLLDGARTQESEAEFVERLWKSPFLPLEPQNIRRWFYQHIVHTSTALFVNGTWIFNTNFVDRKRTMKVEPELVSIIREHAEHLAGTFTLADETT